MGHTKERTVDLNPLFLISPPLYYALVPCYTVCLRAETCSKTGSSMQERTTESSTGLWLRFGRWRL
jgi:hypothetical protein